MVVELVDEVAGGLISSEMKRLKTPTRLYQRVLVDAECTHDGSVKHVAKCVYFVQPRFHD